MNGTVNVNIRNEMVEINKIYLLPVIDVKFVGCPNLAVMVSLVRTVRIGRVTDVTQRRGDETAHWMVFTKI